MSSILKALKKLEEQKTSGQQETGRPTIVLDGGPVSHRNSRSVWPLIVVVLVSVGLAGGWFAWLAGSAKESASIQVASEKVPVTDKPAVQEIASGTVAREEIKSPAEVVPPVERAQAEGGPAVKAEQTDPVKKKVAVVAPARKPTVSKVVKAAPAVETHTTSRQLAELKSEKVIEEVSFHDTPVSIATGPTVVAPSAPAAESALPMMVSEIYYQAEGGGSMAVINDLPVMEGTQVDGAMVEKILPDRVRLSVQGNSFEVPLNKIP